MEGKLAQGVVDGQDRPSGIAENSGRPFTGERGPEDLSSAEGRVWMGESGHVCLRLLLQVFVVDWNDCGLWWRRGERLAASQRSRSRPTMDLLLAASDTSGDTLIRRTSWAPDAGLQAQAGVHSIALCQGLPFAALVML